MHPYSSLSHQTSQKSDHVIMNVCLEKQQSAFRPAFHDELFHPSMSNRPVCQAITAFCWGWGEGVPSPAWFVLRMFPNAAYRLRRSLYDARRPGPRGTGSCAPYTVIIIAYNTLHNHVLYIQCIIYIIINGAPPAWIPATFHLCCLPPQWGVRDIRSHSWDEKVLLTPVMGILQWSSG